MSQRPVLRARPAITTVYLIARREFITRVRTRVFIIGTALILLALAAYFALQVLVLSKQTASHTYPVAFLGDAQSLADPLAASGEAFDYKIEQRQVSGLTQGETEVRMGSLYAVISGSATAPQVLVRDQLNGTLQSILQGIVHQRALDSRLSAAGLDPAAINAGVASARVQVQTLTPASGQRLELVFAGFIVALFLYVALLTYGTFIAQGVVEEKANRIVEILLSTVRPEQLLIGKVVGIGVVGLFQLAIIGFAGLVLSLRTHVFTVPASGPTIVFAGLLWFVLGFSFYAVLFAAAASLVSRQEEVQGAALPVTMLAIIAWLLAIGVLTPMFDGTPMSSTGVLLAMIPPISPVIMPTGMATGDIATWQVLLAVVLTVLTSAAALWIAARIYANSVLRLGARVKLRDALN